MELQKGDQIMIHFREDGIGYALCEYKGRSLDHGYVFESVTYGWKYVLSKDKKMIVWNGKKACVAEDVNGWLRYLPE